MRKAAIKFAAFLFYGVTLLAAIRPNQLVFKTVVRPLSPIRNLFQAAAGRGPRQIGFERLLLKAVGRNYLTIGR